MWPNRYPSFFLLYVGHPPLPWLYVIFLHFSHDRPNRSSPSFSSTTFQNFPGISTLHSEVSKSQHHRKVCSKCSFSLKFKWNYPVKRTFLPSSNWYIINYILSCPYLCNNITISNKCTALLVGRSRDPFLVVSLGIFSIVTDRTMCPGVDSASKNEYQGYILQ